MDIFSALIMIGAVAFFALAFMYNMDALEQVRPRLPAPFRDPLSARFALDNYIWDLSMPANARRKYLASLAFACVGAGCLTVVMIIQGPPFAALLFGAIFALMTGHTLMRWRTYRGRL